MKKLFMIINFQNLRENKKNWLRLHLNKILNQSFVLEFENEENLNTSASVFKLKVEVKKKNTNKHNFKTQV